MLVDGVPNIKDPKKNMIYFMRKLPRDPMFDNPDVPNADTWGKRSYESPLTIQMKVMMYLMFTPGLIKLD